jgi:NAD(P)H dehydrogenase (quinone)
MFAITGATGHLGHATIQALLSKVAPAQIVAVVRDPQKAQQLTQLGVQVRPGDYNDPASLVAAFQGIDTLLFVSTSELEHSLRIQQHRHAIDAAKQAGVRHVVYTSVVNPSRESKFGASFSHLETEEYLRASGLVYTIFRNTLYLELLPMLAGAEAVSSGHIYFAAGEGQVSYALREDIAQALANVLTTAGHDNQVYDIAPGPAHTWHDVAAALSEVTAQPVQYVPISGEEMAAGMRQHQVPEPFVVLMSSMGAAMQANEFKVGSPVLEKLLGHQPTDLKTYLHSVYSK